MQRIGIRRQNSSKVFYITTSIAYTNALPHIGFALELVQADVLARHYRLYGRPVWFLTGTDEHGIKIEKAAKEAGQAPKQFVNQLSKEFRRLKRALNLSWDDFIRTSDKKRHWPGALKLFSKLQANGDVYLKKYRGFYCVGCEGFITEKELVDGCCPIHRRPPEIVEEENFFFRLSRYQKQLKKIIGSGDYLILPESRRNEILSLLDSGLEDLSISRSRQNLTWGIPIPGSDQVMYVWVDALSNYISAIGYGRNDPIPRRQFQRTWPADIHCIGKDISRFHAIIWPAMLISAGLPLPKKLFVHGFITVDGRKMSKSLGNVINPFALIEKYGVEPVRYYLLREIPSDEDGDFSEEKLRRRYEDDLAKGLGNFVSRVSHLAAEQKIKNGKLDRSVHLMIEKTAGRVRERTEKFKLHEAISAVWDLVKFGDAYINTKRPWQNDNPAVMRNLAAIIEQTALLLQPFLPETGEKISRLISKKGNWLKIKKSAPLFPRLNLD